MSDSSKTAAAPGPTVWAMQHDQKQHDGAQLDTLAAILERTGAIIGGVRSDQRALATPNPDFDVAQLVDHVVAWIEVFAASAAGATYEGDPMAVRVADLDEACRRYAAAAATIVEAWRTHGLDREVSSFFGGTAPGAMSFAMTAMEELAHGWDLAVATGQVPGFSEQAGALALEGAHRYLLAEYRGPQSFGDEVPVPDDAPAVDRYLGFVGRDPSWRP